MVWLLGTERCCCSIVATCLAWIRPVTRLVHLRATLQPELAKHELLLPAVSRVSVFARSYYNWQQRWIHCYIWVSSLSWTSVRSAPDMAAFESSTCSSMQFTYSSTVCYDDEARLKRYLNIAPANSRHVSATIQEQQHVAVRLQLPS